MKKILPLESIENETLRNRTDKSLFEKTACHRFHNEGTDTFRKWLKMLSEKERKQVKDMFCISNNMWDNIYNLPYGRKTEDTIWINVLKLIKKEYEENNGFDYHTENTIIKLLKKKFKITKK